MLVFLSYFSARFLEICNFYDFVITGYALSIRAQILTFGLSQHDVGCGSSQRFKDERQTFISYMLSPSNFVTLLKLQPKSRPPVTVFMNLILMSPNGWSPDGWKVSSTTLNSKHTYIIVLTFRIFALWQTTIRFSTLKLFPVRYDRSFQMDGHIILLSR